MGSRVRIPDGTPFLYLFLSKESDIIYNINLTSVDFNQILNELSSPLENKIEVSYLTNDEFVKIYNFPLKDKQDQELLNLDLNLINENELICLICLTPMGESIEEKIINKLKNISSLYFKEIEYLNKKMAAIQAGLGQLGKNQLVYNNNFGFHCDISIFLIYNKIFNLPIREKANFNQLNLCKNCNACQNNCPAKALHGNDNPQWINATACRNFYIYGDHSTISSLKYGINSFLKNEYSDEELKTVKDPASFRKLFGFKDEGMVLGYNNKTYSIDITYCRECMNQLPCRKIKYEYDKNYYSVKEL